MSKNSKKPESLKIRRQKFFRHLSTYLAMSIFFVVLNLLTSPNHLWFYWPILGWGMGIVAEYLQLFVFKGAFEEEDEVSSDSDDHLELEQPTTLQRKEVLYKNDDLV